MASLGRVTRAGCLQGNSCKHGSLKKILCQTGVVIPQVTKKSFRQDKPPQDAHTAGPATAPWTLEEAKSVLECKSRQWNLVLGPLGSLSW